MEKLNTCSNTASKNKTVESIQITDPSGTNFRPPGVRGLPGDKHCINPLQNCVLRLDCLHETSVLEVN